MTEALAKILDAITVALQEQNKSINHLLLLGEQVVKQVGHAPDADDALAGRILAVWDRYPDGQRLTREQIADALGLSRDNGTLAGKLRSLVKEKVLANDRNPPGYYLVDGPTTDQDERN